MELTVEDVEASEATGSHTAPISSSILHVEASDEVQQLVQNLVAIEESNDGEKANISNVILDPGDDLFFSEDMPMHKRQQNMKELDATKEKDYSDNLRNVYWKDNMYLFSRTQVIAHLETAEQKITNIDMLNHLKASILVVRSLHTSHEATTTQIN